MAKTYLTNINLKGNQLLNAAIQPSASAPSALTAGQLYYNTTDGIFYFSTAAGTGSWQPVGVQYIESVNSVFTVTNKNLSLNYGTGLNIISNNLVIDRSTTDTWYDPAGAASSAQSAAESYADTSATNAENAAKSYADSLASNYDANGSAAAAQSAAQSYADTAATNAENAAKSYANTAATNAKNDAKSYADSLASNYDPAGSATTAENNAKSYTDTKVANLVGMAPALLDTLEKIDNAIANDANFSTTLLTDIASAQATAKNYTDSAIAQEVTDRNSAIATAKSEAILEAESYTDSKLSTFGNQTSTDISNAITTAENYADNLVTSLALTSKYVGTISGDGSTDTFTITHNLGKRSVMVQVYQSSGSPDTQWADVEVDLTRISTNAITIGMGVPPTTGTTYEVIIVG